VAKGESNTASIYLIILLSNLVGSIHPFLLTRHNEPIYMGSTNLTPVIRKEKRNLLRKKKVTQSTNSNEHAGHMNLLKSSFIILSKLSWTW